MSNLWIHYHPTTGQIIGWENTDTPYNQAGFDVVEITLSDDAGWAPPDPKRQKIDVATLLVVDLTQAEIADAAAPTDIAIKCAIVSELSATDALMAPDRVVPNREAWTTYRQALRDLNKGSPRPTTAEMLCAFPVRPDGSNAAAKLRSGAARS